MTAPSRASRAQGREPGACSTTPSRARARGTRAICSKSSLTVSQRRRWPSVPRRDDISSVLIIGSGPIVIGQAAEFDYSGTQACHALREEGYRVILVNSNPATIMTDPEVADTTYVEPLTAETVTEILRRERPDALLPTLGGQTALNLAVELNEAGVLDETGVELLGASIPSIRKAEDRKLFSHAMHRIGLNVPPSRTVRSLAEAEQLAAQIGFPLIIRPSFTLGGRGGATPTDPGELRRAVIDGLAASPVGSALAERASQAGRSSS